MGGAYRAGAIEGWNSERRNSMRQWRCVICGWVYDEARGDPAAGIAPGTPWERVPADWLCPDCGVGKEAFEMVEIC